MRINHFVWEHVVSFFKSISILLIVHNLVVKSVEVAIEPKSVSHFRFQPLIPLEGNHVFLKAGCFNIFLFYGGLYISYCFVLNSVTFHFFTLFSNLILWDGKCYEKNI